ncbi:MAG: DUF898 family protein [Pseudomonadota bacterium]
MFWRGQRGTLFWLALKTGALTILTLGFYRFWMKTRLRRWYWSAIRPDGLPLEYVGQPVEKLMGFLIAVVVLAFYLGVVNLILMFVSFSLLAAPGAGYALSFVGVIPLWFYARYRARRYVLARTRWRGIRFGVLAGAWGYAMRALVWWLGTIVTLGLLHPKMRFALEKFRIDRTVWGSVQLEQGGSARMLYPHFAHVMIGLFLTLAPLIDAVNAVSGLADASGTGRLFLMLLVGVPWLIYGLVRYDVMGRKVMANAIRTSGAGGGIGFDAAPRTARMVRIVVLGNIARLFGAMIPVLVFTIAIGAVIAASGMDAGVLDSPFDLLMLGNGPVPGWALLGLLGLAYFGTFLMWSVLTHVFLTMPVLRHYVETLTLTGADTVGAVVQRDRDEFAEAEGFAEALDVGAAI